jgi:hypothetical protein
VLLNAWCLTGSASIAVERETHPVIFKLQIYGALSTTDVDSWVRDPKLNINVNALTELYQDQDVRSRLHQNRTNQTPPLLQNILRSSDS